MRSAESCVTNQCRPLPGLRISALILTVAVPICLGQAPNDEFNTLLMHSTFKIWGPQLGKPDRTSFGTVFFMGRPIKGDPAHAKCVLVTAAHVLDEIEGDKATLLLRRRAADGTYAPFNYEFDIRTKNVPLYVKHAAADVAVMYLKIPADLPISVLPPEFLADDKRIDQLGVHPGDEVSTLGFPLFTHGPGGFPLYRAGRIASYPLTPVAVVKEWLIDILLYGGNSGGPVFFEYQNRSYGGVTHLGGTDRGMLGLVIQQANSSLPEFADKILNYGVIVPATYIRELIDALPE